MTTHQQQDYRKIAANVAWETRAFIDGRFVDALSGKTFETVNPATGKPLARVAELPGRLNAQLSRLKTLRAFPSKIS